ncbi:MAG TPA: ATP-binding protein [Candidatus Cloacimonadota bacterium]|nr:ATP-binding protein [Candidatus Cloacimonadota bacterium]HPM02944.1 ATP-binding protein [Candidatus Cloacimonadota bacterium]
MPFFNHIFSKKSNLNSRIFFSELINSYSIVVNKRMILEITKGKINEILPKHQIYMMDKQEESYHYIMNEEITIPAQSRLINWFYQNQTFLELTGGVSDYIKMEMNELESFSPSTIFPIILHNYIPAITIFSGPKLKNDVKDLLQTVFQLAALAYESVERFDREIRQLDNNYQQKKMVMVGRMASSIAHEIRNPLTSIRSSVQLMESVLVQPEIKKIAGNVINEVDRINNITKDLLNYAKPRQLNIVNVDMVSLIKKMISLNENLLKEKNIQLMFKFDAAKKWIARADEDSMIQVLTNFMNNSIEAMELSADKVLSIELVWHDELHGELHWKDTGCGIQIEILEHVTEPFFTTKSSGTGLGLAIVKQILDQHRFDLTINSKLGKGTSITISLNLAEELKKW